MDSREFCNQYEIDFQIDKVMNLFDPLINSVYCLTFDPVKSLELNDEFQTAEIVLMKPKSQYFGKNKIVLNTTDQKYIDNQEFLNWNFVKGYLWLAKSYIKNKEVNNIWNNIKNYSLLVMDEIWEFGKKVTLTDDLIEELIVMRLPIEDFEKKFKFVIFEIQTLMLLTDYFDNLDIQDEIDDFLTQPEKEFNESHIRHYLQILKEIQESNNYPTVYRYYNLNSLQVENDLFYNLRNILTTLEDNKIQLEYDLEFEYNPISSFEIIIGELRSKIENCHIYIDNFDELDQMVNEENQIV